MSSGICLLWWTCRWGWLLIEEACWEGGVTTRWWLNSDSMEFGFMVCI